MGRRRQARREGRHLVKHGETPRYRVALSRREVVEMPWLEFDGDGPAAIAEAARRSIAAELGVRADQVEVEPEDADRPNALSRRTEAV
jgi:hypothetical protein